MTPPWLARLRELPVRIVADLLGLQGCPTCGGRELRFAGGGFFQCPACRNSGDALALVRSVAVSRGTGIERAGRDVLGRAHLGDRYPARALELIQVLERVVGTKRSREYAGWALGRAGLASWADTLLGPLGVAGVDLWRRGESRPALPEVSEELLVDLEASLAAPEGPGR